MLPKPQVERPVLRPSPSRSACRINSYVLHARRTITHLAHRTSLHPTTSPPGVRLAYRLKGTCSTSSSAGKVMMHGTSPTTIPAIPSHPNPSLSVFMLTPIMPHHSFCERFLNPIQVVRDMPSIRPPYSKTIPFLHLVDPQRVDSGFVRAVS